MHCWCVLLVAVVSGGFGSAATALQHQPQQQQQLGAFRRRLLASIGFAAQPQLNTMNVSRAEYERMHHAYLASVETQRLQEAEPSPAQPRTFHSIQHEPSTAPEWLWGHRRAAEAAVDSWWLYFPVHRELQGGSSEMGVVRLLARGRRPAGRRRRRAPLPALRLFQLLPGGEEVLLDERRFDPDAGDRWMELRAQSALDDWLESPDSNRGLKLECKGCRLHGADVDTQERLANSTEGVVLNILSSSHSRQRRAISLAKERQRRSCKGNKNTCCRHSMEVVFREFPDFHYVLQPEKYDAGVCRGRCPARHNPASYHAFIQSLVWRKDRSRAPRPCCAPHKLKSLEMLVLDPDDSTKLKQVTFKDMAVVNCACT